MREIRPSGSEGGVALTPPSLPLSGSALDKQARSGARPSSGASIRQPMLDPFR